jgi:D-3-phosphoglycerate dehydrogenase
MKVLFIDSTHESIVSNFKKAGWKVGMHHQSSREELLGLVHTYDGIIIRSRFRLDANFLQNAKKLKFIGRPGAGLENIDLDYCKNNNISVFRSPEGNRDAVAEHAIGMILMMLNNLKKADSEVRKGVWLREENRGHELMGKTFGIIGYGVMGKAIAQRLKGFGVEVIAYDKYLINYSDENATEVNLDELQKRSDFVSLHLPQAEETINYLNKQFIDGFEKPFYLINTARGKSVDTQAVLDGLEKGQIIGACLDVLEFESSSFESSPIANPVFQKLVESDKVLLSPHIAGWTYESDFKMGDFLSKKILKHFNN